MLLGQLLIYETAKTSYFIQLRRMEISEYCSPVSIIDFEQVNSRWFGYLHCKAAKTSYFIKQEVLI